MKRFPLSTFNEQQLIINAHVTQWAKRSPRFEIDHSSPYEKQKW